jgi:twitching motility protein PilT
VLPTDGKSHVNQRELGKGFFSFADALRQALRQDPDVILVGELRDSETMRTALTAAETGHLVFGTLHTYDTASSVSRLVASFGGDEQNQVRAQLAYILKGIVSQTLVPHSSGKGRVAAFEVMVANPAIANNLRKIDGHTSLRQSLETGRAEGMQTMEMALADLVRAGQVRQEDAEFKAKDLDDFLRRLNAPDTPYQQ